MINKQAKNISKEKSTSKKTLSGLIRRVISNAEAATNEVIAAGKPAKNAINIIDKTIILFIKSGL